MALRRFLQEKASGPFLWGSDGDLIELMVKRLSWVLDVRAIDERQMQAEADAKADARRGKREAEIELAEMARKAGRRTIQDFREGIAAELAENQTAEH